MSWREDTSDPPRVKLGQKREAVRAQRTREQLGAGAGTQASVSLALAVPPAPPARHGPRLRPLERRQRPRQITNTEEKSWEVRVGQEVLPGKGDELKFKKKQVGRRVSREGGS